MIFSAAVSPIRYATACRCALQFPRPSAHFHWTLDRRPKAIKHEVKKPGVLDVPGQKRDNTHIHDPQSLDAHYLEIFVDTCVRLIGFTHLHGAAGVPHANCRFADVCLHVSCVSCVIHCRRKRRNRDILRESLHPTLHPDQLQSEANLLP